MTTPRWTMIAGLAFAMTSTGCDSLTQSGSETETVMKNVEILPGSASDEMITLDSANGDGTAIDTSAALGPPVPGGPAATTGGAGDDAAEVAPGDDPDAAPDVPELETRPGDTIVRPPSARPASPAAKN